MMPMMIAGPIDCQKLYPSGGTPLVIAKRAIEYPVPQVKPNKIRVIKLIIKRLLELIVVIFLHQRVIRGVS